MNTVLEAYLCSDDVEEFDDFLQAKKPVWILGKCYNGVEGTYIQYNVFKKYTFI